MDRHPEEITELLRQGRHAAVREPAGVSLGVGHQGVDLAVIGAAGPKREIGDVAWKADHGGGSGRRIDADDHERVRQGVGPDLARIEAEEQDVDPRLGGRRCRDRRGLRQDRDVL